MKEATQDEESVFFETENGSWAFSCTIDAFTEAFRKISNEKLSDNEIDNFNVHELEKYLFNTARERKDNQSFLEWCARNPWTLQEEYNLTEEECEQVRAFISWDNL